jgi:hypothetical protein
MTDPIVFIIRNRVKEGMFDDFRNHYQKIIPLTEKTKQGTIIQLAYINEDARAQEREKQRIIYLNVIKMN